MKKFVMGLIVGVAITAAGSAYAEEIQSLVGKTIQGQFPVKVAGVQLTEQAAVIDGTSYLPVRAIGEALNMDVSFNADLGIELKAKGEDTMSVEPMATETQIVPEKSVQERIVELNKKLADDKSLLETHKSLKKTNEETLNMPGAPKESVQQAVDMYAGFIIEIEKRISEYEAQIADLEAQQ